MDFNAELLPAVVRECLKRENKETTFGSIKSCKSSTRLLFFHEIVCLYDQQIRKSGYSLPWWLKWLKWIGTSLEDPIIDIKCTLLYSGQDSPETQDPFCIVVVFSTCVRAFVFSTGGNFFSHEFTHEFCTKRTSISSQVPVRVFLADSGSCKNGEYTETFFLAIQSHSCSLHVLDTSGGSKVFEYGSDEAKGKLIGINCITGGSSTNSSKSLFLYFERCYIRDDLSDKGQFQSRSYHFGRGIDATLSAGRFLYLRDLPAGGKGKIIELPGGISGKMAEFNDIETMEVDCPFMVEIMHVISVFGQDGASEVLICFSDGCLFLLKVDSKKSPSSQKTFTKISSHVSSFACTSGSPDQACVRYIYENEKRELVTYNVKYGSQQRILLDELETVPLKVLAINTDSVLLLQDFFSVGISSNFLNTHGGISLSRMDLLTPLQSVRMCCVGNNYSQALDVCENYNVDTDVVYTNLWESTRDPLYLRRVTNSGYRLRQTVEYIFHCKGEGREGKECLETLVSIGLMQESGCEEKKEGQEAASSSHLGLLRLYLTGVQHLIVSYSALVKEENFNCEEFSKCLDPDFFVQLVLKLSENTSVSSLTVIFSSHPLLFCQENVLRGILSKLKPSVEVCNLLARRKLSGEESALDEPPWPLRSFSSAPPAPPTFQRDYLLSNLQYIFTLPISEILSILATPAVKTMDFPLFHFIEQSLEIHVLLGSLGSSLLNNFRSLMEGQNYNGIYDMVLMKNRSLVEQFSKLLVWFSGEEEISLKDKTKCLEVLQRLSERSEISVNMEELGELSEERFSLEFAFNVGTRVHKLVQESKSCDVFNILISELTRDCYEILNDSDVLDAQDMIIQLLRSVSFLAKEFPLVVPELVNKLYENDGALSDDEKPLVFALKELEMLKDLPRFQGGILDSGRVHALKKKLESYIFIAQKSQTAAKYPNIDKSDGDDTRVQKIVSAALSNEGRRHSVEFWKEVLNDCIVFSNSFAIDNAEPRVKKRLQLMAAKSCVPGLLRAGLVHVVDELMQEEIFGELGKLAESEENEENGLEELVQLVLRVCVEYQNAPFASTKVDDENFNSAQAIMRLLDRYDPAVDSCNKFLFQEKIQSCNVVDMVPCVNEKFEFTLVDPSSLQQERRLFLLYEFLKRRSIVVGLSELRTSGPGALDVILRKLKEGEVSFLKTCSYRDFRNFTALVGSQNLHPQGYLDALRMAFEVRKKCFSLHDFAFFGSCGRYFVKTCASDLTLWAVDKEHSTLYFEFFTLFREIFESVLQLITLEDSLRSSCDAIELALGWFCQDLGGCKESQESQESVFRVKFSALIQGLVNSIQLLRAAQDIADADAKGTSLACILNLAASVVQEDIINIIQLQESTELKGMGSNQQVADFFSKLLGTCWLACDCIKQQLVEIMSFESFDPKVFTTELEEYFLTGTIGTVFEPRDRCVDAFWRSSESSRCACFAVHLALSLIKIDRGSEGARLNYKPMALSMISMALVVVVFLSGRSFVGVEELERVEKLLMECEVDESEESKTTEKAGFAAKLARSLVSNPGFLPDYVCVALANVIDKFQATSIPGFIDDFITLLVAKLFSKKISSAGLYLLLKNMESKPSDKFTKCYVKEGLKLLRASVANNFIRATVRTMYPWQAVEDLRAVSMLVPWKSPCLGGWFNTKILKDTVLNLDVPSVSQDIIEASKYSLGFGLLEIVRYSCQETEVCFRSFGRECQRLCDYSQDFEGNSQESQDLLQNLTRISSLIISNFKESTRDVPNFESLFESYTGGKEDLLDQIFNLSTDIEFGEFIIYLVVVEKKRLSTAFVDTHKILIESDLGLAWKQCLVLFASEDMEPSGANIAIARLGVMLNFLKDIKHDDEFESWSKRKFLLSYLYLFLSIDRSGVSQVPGIEKIIDFNECLDEFMSIKASAELNSKTEEERVCIEDKELKNLLFPSSLILPLSSLRVPAKSAQDQLQNDLQMVQDTAETVVSSLKSFKGFLSKGIAAVARDVKRTVAEAQERQKGELEGKQKEDVARVEAEDWSKDWWKDEDEDWES